MALTFTDVYNAYLNATHDTGERKYSVIYRKAWPDSWEWNLVDFVDNHNFYCCVCGKPLTRERIKGIISKEGCDEGHLLCSESCESY
tara:strand:+ start:132 stop:392 length:261 start_codon:yes stop_codon:yes gene_type:complete